MATKTRPYSDLPIPPGETLAEELAARRLPQAALARRMGRPLQTINMIVTGKKRITAETALDLERVLGIPAHVWLGLQAEYDETRARLARQTAPAVARPRAVGVPPGVHMPLTMKKRDAFNRAGLTVWWPNPPDPRAPLEIERVFRGRRYRYEISARGLLTPTEAAAVMASGVGGDPANKMRVYRLVRAGVLKGVHHGGKGRQLMVTASSVRAYVAKVKAQAPQKGKKPRLWLTG